MNKTQLKHFWAKIRPLKPRYFLILAVIFGAIALYALRQNNLNMIKLRSEVSQADQQNGDVETALRNLREFVYSHMNTNLSSGNNPIKPPIQLKYRYDRLVQAEKDKTVASNTQIYTDAQAYCEKQVPQGLSGRGRVPCIQDYVTSHGVKEQSVPDALYKFDFVSPTWSPDLAGWSLVISGLFFILFLFSAALDHWIKAELKS